MIYTRFWCATWLVTSPGCGHSLGEFIAAESAHNAFLIFKQRYPTATWVKIDGTEYEIK